MKAGSIIAGKYELVALLGEGGMGSVWRARRAGWPADVAVKVIHAVLAQDSNAVERFRREARMAAEMRGPNVVRVLDDGVDEASKSPFLVMELLAGETLAARLERRVRLSPRETLHIVRQVESVLTTAHEKQVVHRDLKPENVFLTGPADTPIVKVLDFGVAKWGVESVRLNAKTATGSILGTPFYMSPEQLRDSSRVDYRCDLWSVGVIVFECLTGRRPFDAESLVELAIQICQGARPVPSSAGPVPPGFDAWFARSASLDPVQRFQSAAELSETLSRVFAGQGAAGALGSAEEAPTLASPGAVAVSAHAQSVGPLSSTRPAGGLIRRPRRWLLTAGAPVLLLAGLAVMAWRGGVGPARDEPPSTAFLPSPGAPSAAAAPAPEAVKPGVAEAPHVAAASAPVVSILPATPSPSASTQPASTAAVAVAPSTASAPSSPAPALPAANVASSANAASLAAAPAAVLPTPSESTKAPAGPAPAPRPSSTPKPSWDSSFERTQPKAPRWDPSFDRR